MKIEEKALLGIPIETKFGEVKPLSIMDYMTYGSELAAVTFNKRRVLHEIRLNQDSEMQNSPELTKMLRELDENYSLKEIIVTYMEPYFHAYSAIVSRCFFFNEVKEVALEKAHNLLVDINNEEFDEIRQIILSLNNQPEQDAELDPVLQSFKEKAIRFHNSKEQDNGTSMSTIITSIVTQTGLDFSKILKWNVTQVLQIYSRLQMFKAYDATTLFATVTDKITIEPWDKNIEVAKDNLDKYSMSLDEFSGKVGDGITK